MDGDSQTAGQGKEFGRPLQVKAWSSDGQVPISGAEVAFTISDGDAAFTAAGSR
ncbi:hypothetical protein ACFW1F_14285 [Streptomyces bungoensis]|uniref:hypothetical protein n=1 Tax=Streptomyces bungoensis TaxID=285568 RepID=UPI003440A573